MDQIFSVIRRSLKRKREPESEDRNEACKVLFVKHSNKDEEEDDVSGLVAAAEANREAWVEVVIARCEVASLNDGCKWGWCGGGSSDSYREYYYDYKAAPDCPDRKELIHGCHGVGARNPFPRYKYSCIMVPGCPVTKEVQRCLDEPSVLINTYYGTHNHPLPDGTTATALSDGTSSFIEASVPHHASYLIKQLSHPPNIRSINPNDLSNYLIKQLSCPSINPNNPSKGVVVDLTINSYDPPQFPMPKSPVRDQDQNQPPRILVGKDSNKDSKKDVQLKSSTTSTSFSPPHWNYDVFLSFRGEDTRINFTDHLHYALLRFGIYTFRDVEELRRGKTISTELSNAIRRSRISIVIFSEGYASSRWCLDELVQIMHCKNTIGHTLLSIFYHVDPSDVRNQTGTFAEAFAKHEERFHTDMGRVQGWRKALTEAADCSGWDIQSFANGYESRFIEEIVAQVSNEVKPIGLNVTRHPIGLNYRFHHVTDLLNLGTSGVHIVGIYGMGGIGKTTLAKVVYNQICYGFEGSSFLFDIKEISKKHKGLVRLQEQLVSDMLKTKNLKIDNADRGINLIEKIIHGKRVLVVLDGVDDLEQLHALVEKQWFGPGSRIIVTTRDEHLLSQMKVDRKYKVKELNHWESLQLFSWHAFNMANPIKEYLELSTKALVYAEGIPFALELLGSFLKDRGIAEWKSTLKKLRRNPIEKIQNILRISFDTLDDDTKNIFLDIACFFVNMDKKYAIKILDGCNFFPRIGIPILIQRSLVTIDDEKILRMHGLIQDMGRKIVHEESSNFPGERSRLGFYEDVLNVLRNHTGTKTVEGLMLKLYEGVRSIETTAFKNMKNLRLLQISNVHLIGSCEHLSKELRWLCWHECPLEFLPHNFHLEDLIILDMQHSNFKEVWKKNKILNKLKVLNLSNSKRLTKSIDFSHVPKLEILMLEGCTRLVEIHESIGCLKNLVLLNLKGSKSLKNLPSSISNLISLKTLDLSNCLKVDKLPDQVGRMMALIELHLDGTAIKQLPPSFGLLRNLKTLSLSGHKKQSSRSWWYLLSSLLSPKSLNRVSLLPASLSGLRSLTMLNLSGRNLSEDGFPVDFGSLSSLHSLDLSRNNFRNLPDCISCLPKLYDLHLGECTALQSVSGLFASVGFLDTSDCTSMTRLSISPNHKRNVFDLRNCHKLTEIQGLENWEFAFNNLAFDFRSHLQFPSTMDDDECRAIFLPGGQVPNWFSHQGIGCLISFHVPSLSKGQFLRVLVCAVYATDRVYIREGNLPHMHIWNKTRGNSLNLGPTDIRASEHPFTFPKHSFTVPKKSHCYLCLTPPIRRKYELESGHIFNELVIDSGDEIEVSISHWGIPDTKKIGIHLLVDEPNVM